MNVDVNDVNGTGRKLDELCRQFGYLRGIPVEDSVFGYEKSAYQYFFEYSNVYRTLSPYHQLTLSQCIEAMYVNKNDPIWHDAIDYGLLLLSSHGGLCLWRAEAIINTLYSCLHEFLRENHIGYQSSGDDLKDILDDGDPDFVASEVAMKYFRMFTDKKYLIQKSQDIVSSRLNHDEIKRLFTNVSRNQMSFNDYCRLSGKSPEETQLLVAKIDASEDEYHDILKRWIRGECSLTLDDIDDSHPGIISLLIDLTGVGNDFEHIGCPELNSVEGFKFIITCIQYGYFLR